MPPRPSSSETFAPSGRTTDVSAVAGMAPVDMKAFASCSSRDCSPPREDRHRVERQQVVAVVAEHASRRTAFAKTLRSPSVPATVTMIPMPASSAARKIVSASHCVGPASIASRFVSSTERLGARSPCSLDHVGSQRSIRSPSRVA